MVVAERVCKLKLVLEAARSHRAQSALWPALANPGNLPHLGPVLQFARLQ